MSSLAPPSHPEPRPALCRRWGTSVFFGLWFAVTGVFGAWMVAQHALPLPEARPATQPAGPAPVAWHVLGADCGCSASIADDLARRGPRAGWREQVWLVGDEPFLAAKLTRAGYTVFRSDPEQLARTHGIQGAPWLVLFDAMGRPAYNGGYARLRPGLPQAADLCEELMDGVAAGRTVASLPAYGCATSNTLRDRLDPFRLRFANSP